MAAFPVSPVRNEQLKFYALGFLDKAPAAKGATLHIVQPWSAEGSGSYWCPVDELHEYMLETQAAEAKIMTGDTTLTVAPETLPSTVGAIQIRLKQKKDGDLFRVQTAIKDDNFSQTFQIIGEKYAADYMLRR